MQKKQKKLGLVSRVIPSEGFLDKVIEIAIEISKKITSCFKNGKRCY